MHSMCPKPEANEPGRGATHPGPFLADDCREVPKSSVADGTMRRWPTWQTGGFMCRIARVAEAAGSIE